MHLDVQMFRVVQRPVSNIPHESGSQFNKNIFYAHHSTELYPLPQIFNFQYFVLIDILLFKP